MAAMSFENCMSHTIMFGRVFGLMPISGVMQNKSNYKISCSWWGATMQQVYSMLVLTGSFLFILFVISWYPALKNLSLEYFIVLIVYVGAFTNFILFHRLAKKWTHLIRAWDAMEVESMKFVAVSDKTSLKRRLNVNVMVIFAVAIGENF
jgi:hypothetical protein